MIISAFEATLYCLLLAFLANGYARWYFIAQETMVTLQSALKLAQEAVDLLPDMKREGE